ncbi:uncharacterized protein LACBIDRAFT_308005 [Laccaria bicolor S238N-H82]|uniref:Predicted protein n=1 Tax=Laccaria bicolor (strain S238N-H82 / ATCC MYA-4686) TaxID=486041 RepID=B0DRE3_LACBS|nr:uncharacterized protein LACBIDRAFT_308005 [Laccaria bicolor S238N-H82]EDR02856.1 predicted protein [Laccaria bicolor S238N-H82]|eukprot:XP_001886566.1 predicted protein [Laccaria bicolor S238N-H82]
MPNHAGHGFWSAWPRGEVVCCCMFSSIGAHGPTTDLASQRDEQVGVYGMLFTRVPKYEELKVSEQELYHFSKDLYNESARKDGKSLYFAKSGTSGETWVPLIEKAYAKLHSNYSHLVAALAPLAASQLHHCLPLHH